MNKTITECELNCHRYVYIDIFSYTSCLLHLRHRSALALTMKLQSLTKVVALPNLMTPFSSRRSLFLTHVLPKYSWLDKYIEFSLLGGKLRTRKTRKLCKIHKEKFFKIKLNVNCSRFLNYTAYILSTSLIKLSTLRI